MSLAADKPGAVASTSKQVLGWAMDGLPDVLNNSVTLLISTCPVGLTQNLGFQSGGPSKEGFGGAVSLCTFLIRGKSHS